MPITDPIIATPRASVPGHALPLLIVAIAAASFVSMDSVIKLLAARYDSLQLSFFRFAAGSLFALPLWLWRRTPLPSRGNWRVHALRSVLLLFSLVGYFHALTQLPLALAVTISYLAPIFVAVLSVPLLKEKPSSAIWLALGAGLVGVSISVWPELAAGVDGISTARLLGMASAAAAALAFAGVMLLARRMANRDSIWTILLVQSLLPLLLLAGPAALTWKPVPATDIALILLAGGLGTLGLLGITWAFTRLEASRLAPMEYTSFVWAALLGYLLFGEVPTLTTAASATLIIGGCLLLLRR
ncbi:MAG: DMT family transporter [Burkholderiales bacterium]